MDQAGQLKGEHPLLIARFKKLVDGARLALLGDASVVNPGMKQTAGLSQTGNTLDNVSDYLSKYQGQKELFLDALDLIIKHTVSSEGYLYIAIDGSLDLVVQLAVQPPPEKTVKILQSSFARIIESDGEDDTDVTETQTETQTDTDIDDVVAISSESERINFWLLLAEDNSKRVPVGAVILKRICPDSPIEQSFLDAVARSLHQKMQEEQAKQQQTQPAEFGTAGSRYQIEAMLGEGGMATVYKVRDRETARLLALKRARAAAKRGDQSMDLTDVNAHRTKLENALRREYQMLKSLAHPRIVEVYDFGVDQEGPYYTMELLEGSSLRHKAPMDWRAACSLLRDLASALALLHARRLLHRDVSPRNVGMTQDNHIKLMDFCTTATMGMSKDRVGTPPFVSPEMVFNQKLDQRSDLYSFGALAYWLLTGRHAFPARDPGELNALWRSQPFAVSEVVHEFETLEPIPEALDQLVMSLLNIDPLARPPSAAEVMERLSVIASLPIDEQLTVPQAYLSTPTLLGRQLDSVPGRHLVAAGTTG